MTGQTAFCFYLSANVAVWVIYCDSDLHTLSAWRWEHTIYHSGRYVGVISWMSPPGAELDAAEQDHTHPCDAGLAGPSFWPSAGSVWPSVMGSHSWTCLLLKRRKRVCLIIQSTGRDLLSCVPLWPLKRPLMPPIFLTIWANLVYCVSNSWTSLVATPEPRATLWILFGCLLNSLAPSLLSSSEKTVFNHLSLSSECDGCKGQLTHVTLVVHAVHDGHQLLQSCHWLLFISFTHKICTEAWNHALNASQGGEGRKRGNITAVYMTLWCAVDYESVCVP